jgi:hypothetical protein
LLELRKVFGLSFLNKMRHQYRSGLCQTCIAPSRSNLQLGQIH